VRKFRNSKEEVEGLNSNVSDLSDELNKFKKDFEDFKNQTLIQFQESECEIERIKKIISRNRSIIQL
jgi:archaellum component FlaC